MALPWHALQTSSTDGVVGPAGLNERNADVDFIDDVKTRKGRFENRLNHTIETEEATKTSFVLPFIQMLGYDIFDPSEVVPEFTADHGTKRGEKVDYALLIDEKPVILIEAKRYGSNLDEENVSQLFRYFTVTETRFGILTDGIAYRFFSDLEQPNTMDHTPFFEFNMLDFTDQQVRELKLFTRDSFQLSETTDAARQLKYMSELKRIIARQMADPSDEMVRLLVKPFYPGRLTQTARDMFTRLVRDAFTQQIDDSVDSRLNAALARVEEQKRESHAAQQAEPEEPEPEPEPEFTDTEIEACHIVKAILSEVVEVERVGLRRYARHTSVLLDDSRRRVICELWVRGEKPAIRVGRTSDPVDINSLSGIYEHADGLRAVLDGLLMQSVP